MSLTQTTLSAAITAGQTKNLPITSTAAGFPAAGVVGSRQLIQIDGEYMLLDQVVASGIINVLMRGFNGTQAIAHDTLASVVTSSSAGDFPDVPTGAVANRPSYADEIQTIGQNVTTLTTPTRNTTSEINKATALASTAVAAPSKAADGLRWTFVSKNAVAHVITSSALFGAGAASPYSTATFAAQIGAGFTMQATNGIWSIISATGITFS